MNKLIATSKNGELGYHAAAADVHNTQLETVFNDYAKQRAGFARQLQAEVERLGGTSTDSGTLGAAVHRGWMDLKSAISGGDGAAIVAACETGEDHAAAEFERVVNLDISGQTRTLVEKQWQKIKEAHAHLLRLKDETRRADYPKTD
ncbi:MAG: PA2169 family four-helix-bundle protein [Acidobacteriota bacterium]|nr:PA2169 family four-helix-bundle protein [Acidobacteriota bacterium]